MKRYQRIVEEILNSKKFDYLFIFRVIFDALNTQNRNYTQMRAKYFEFFLIYC